MAFAYLAVIAAVVGWSSPKGIAANDAVQVAMNHPNSGRCAREDTHSHARNAGANGARGKQAARQTSCAECGVVESMQQIDTRLEFTGWCDAAEIARSQNSGDAFGRGFRRDRESLRETVAAAIAANRSTTKDGVTTRHRIVVRMRNGKRQIFDESAPRMVNVGDRIVVIAGAARSNG